MNEKIPLVAIKCMTYNHEPYIKQCLEGFIMQKTNFRFVAIVHDDASTDGTADIIKEYGEMYPNIIKPIFEKENQYSKGDGSLRKIMDKAVYDSNCKYVAMCEGDDYWTDPYKLQKQVEYLEHNKECSLCFHDAVTIDCRINEIINKFNIPKKNRITTKDLLLHGWFIPTASVVIRKENMPTEEWLRKAPSGDVTIYFSASQKGYLHALPDKMSVYRFYSLNSCTYRNKKNNAFIKVLLNYTKYLTYINKKFFKGKYWYLIIYRWARTTYTILRMCIQNLFK